MLGKIRSCGFNSATAFFLTTAIMGFASTWYSHPRRYGPGSRYWYGRTFIRIHLSHYTMGNYKDITFSIREVTAALEWITSVHLLTTCVEQHAMMTVNRNCRMIGEVGPLFIDKSAIR